MLTIFRILLALAAVAGVGFGSFYLVRAIDDTAPEQAVVASPTATATPLPTNTPEPTPTTVLPSPTAEVALPTPTPEVARSVPGERVLGGQGFRVGGLLLRLPDAGEFIIGVGIADPGGPFIRIYHVPTGSSLFLDPLDGHELERHSLNPAADAVFDSIVASLSLVPK